VLRSLEHHDTSVPGDRTHSPEMIDNFLMGTSQLPDSQWILSLSGQCLPRGISVQPMWRWQQHAFLIVSHSPMNSVLSGRDKRIGQWVAHLVQDWKIPSSGLSNAECPLLVGAPHINSGSYHSNKAKEGRWIGWPRTWVEKNYSERSTQTQYYGNRLSSQWHFSHALGLFLLLLVHKKLRLSRW